MLEVINNNLIVDIKIPIIRYIVLDHMDDIEKLASSAYHFKHKVIEIALDIDISKDIDIIDNRKCIIRTDRLSKDYQIVGGLHTLGYDDLQAYLPLTYRATDDMMWIINKKGHHIF